MLNYSVAELREKKNVNLEFEELEDRLEMAQIAASDVIRCNLGDVQR